MKILITGSAGFIGYHVARQLLNDDMHVIERFLRDTCAVSNEGETGTVYASDSSSKYSIRNGKEERRLLDEFEDLMGNSSESSSARLSGGVVMSRKAMDQLAAEFQELLQFIGACFSSKKM